MNIVQERITHTGRSFRVLRLELDSFRGRRHRHRQWELTWIERGAGLRFVGDNVAPYEAGDLVLLGPHVPHTWLSYTPKALGRRPGEQSSHKPKAAQQHAATVLQFPSELLDKQVVPEWAALTALAERAAYGLKVCAPTKARVIAQLQQLPSAKGLFGVAAVVNILAELLVDPSCLQPLSSHAVPVAPQGMNRSGADKDRRIALLTDWIQKNLGKPLTVADAAALVHVSTSAFGRFFRRELGKSYTNYINDMRCSEACLRLRGSDQPVAVIALDCGFQTLSNFNQQFKRRTGTTPRAFRHAAGR